MIVALLIALASLGCSEISAQRPMGSYWDSYLILQPRQCHRDADCPLGAFCIHHLCFWSHCLVDGSQQRIPTDPKNITDVPGKTRKCPHKHPFAYSNGDYCCLTREAGYSQAGGVKCTGGQVSMDSSCCKDDAYVNCPGGAKCIDNPTGPIDPTGPTVKCPQNYPFAYSNGDYCCLTKEAGNRKVNGVKCTGGQVSMDSPCCKDDAFINCPGGAKCIDNPTGPTVKCPQNYPFAYSSGDYCCLSKEAGNSQAADVKCNGGQVSMDSSCCKDDAFVNCPGGGKCIDNPTGPTVKCPRNYPFAYSNGDYCCLTKEAGNRKVNGIKCTGGQVSMDSPCCKDDAFINCPGGAKCIDNPTSPTAKCPQNYPFAYSNGDYCCLTKEAGYSQAGPGGVKCTGGQVSMDSPCCKDDAYVNCPGGSKCIDNPTSPIVKCPQNYPFAYSNGDYCCLTEEAGFSQAGGVMCSGGRVSMDSSCCKDDANMICPGGAKCIDNPAGSVTRRPPPAVLTTPTPSIVPVNDSTPVRAIEKLPVTGFNANTKSSWFPDVDTHKNGLFSVDDILSYTDRNVTVTQFGPNEWLVVDMGMTRKVVFVKIYSRLDCCQERLGNLEIRIGDDDPESNLASGPDAMFTVNRLCGGAVFKGLKNKRAYLVRCIGGNSGIGGGGSGVPPSLDGRFVSIQQQDPTSIVEINELEVYVYGDELQQIPATKFTGETKTSLYPDVDTHQNGQFAVDGLLSPSSTSLTISKRGTNEWLLIDLGDLYLVSALKVFPRVDCCQERINLLQVRVGNVDPRSTVGPDDPFTANEICGAHIKGISSPAPFVHHCFRPLDGRLVSIQNLSPDASYIEINEVLVYGEPAQMQKIPPTNFNAYTKTCPRDDVDVYQNGQLACDGIISPDASKASASKPGDYEWLIIDIGKKMGVVAVKLFARLDCCADQMGDVEIRVGDLDPFLASGGVDAMFTANDVCGVVRDNLLEEKSLLVRCEPGLRGRYVSVQKRSRNATLGLSEVDIYSPPNDSGWYKLPCKTFKAITKTSWFGPRVSNEQNGYFAIDGKFSNYEQKMAVSQQGKNQWLLIDMGQPYRVAFVKLYARLDCCLNRFNNHEVRVGDVDPRTTVKPDDMFDANQVCGQRTPVTTTYTTHDVRCGKGGMVGRYVSVQRPGPDSFIELNEVEIYGSWIEVPSNSSEPDDQGSLFELGVLPKGPLFAFTSSSSIPGVTSDQNAAFAIDGILSPTAYNITLTKRNRNEWLLIDLGRSYKVTAVRVYSRLDCCAESVDNVEVRVGPDDPRPSVKPGQMFTANAVCGARMYRSRSLTHTARCGDWQNGQPWQNGQNGRYGWLDGQYVSLQREGKGVAIEINEVDIYVSVEGCVSLESMFSPNTATNYLKKYPRLPSAKQCYRECLKKEACQGFSWFQTNICFLIKQAGQDMQPAQGVASATRDIAECIAGKGASSPAAALPNECPLMNTGFTSGKVVGTYEGVTTARECADLCHGDDKCRGFTWELCKTCSAFGEGLKPADKSGAISGRQDCQMNCNRWRGLVFIGGYNYGGVGSVTEVVRTLDACNGLTRNVDSATLIPPHPYIRTYYGGIAAVFNGNIVVCGGFNAERSYTSECYQLVEAPGADPIWNSLPPLSKPRTNADAVVVGGGGCGVPLGLWVLGGQAGSMVGDLLPTSELFDGQTWSAGPPGPNPSIYEMYHCLVQLTDTTTLLIGGESHTRSSFVYDWKAQKWTKKGDLVFPRERHACARLPKKYGGNVIVVGGGVTNFTNIETYSENTGKWSSLKHSANPNDDSVYTQTISHPCLVTLDDELYLMGGDVNQQQVALEGTYVWSQTVKHFVKSKLNGPFYPNFNAMCVPHV